MQTLFTISFKMAKAISSSKNLFSPFFILPVEKQLHYNNPQINQLTVTEHLFWPILKLTMFKVNLLLSVPYL